MGQQQLHQPSKSGSHRQHNFVMESDVAVTLPERARNGRKGQEAKIRQGTGVGQGSRADGCNNPYITNNIRQHGMGRRHGQGQQAKQDLQENMAGGEPTIKACL